MDIERAREITAACVRNAMSRVIGPEYVPLPECELEEMLVANRLVREANERAQVEAKPDADGVTRYKTSMTVDPRGIAAAYAFEKYWQDPEALLEAVGFRLRDPDEAEEDAEDDEATT